MAYNHDGDIGPDYPFAHVDAIVREPLFRETWHGRAEEYNFLNVIGHEAIRSALYKMGGVVDSELGGLGATLYEVATMPEFTGTSIAKTPTYKSGKAQKVALEAAFSLECYDPYEMLSLTSAAVDIMDEDAPGLSELIERSSRSILGEGFSDSDLHRIKSGASAARTLHITAEHRMAGGTLDDIS